MTIQIGTLIEEKYKVLEMLGSGGGGKVFRVRDVTANKEFALKVIADQVNIPPDAKRRFFQEVEFISELEHPNIVKIHDFSIYKGMPYYVMDYMPRGSLGDRLSSGDSYDYQDAARLVLQVARAVSYVHEKGVIHRDIKPDNILFDDDFKPMLSDFGVARAAGESRRITRDGSPIGTPGYQAPEQIEGGAVGVWTDMYALGLVYFQMITGRLPHLYDTTGELPVPKASQFSPGIPEHVDQFLAKALARSPKYRFQSMAEFLQALELLSVGKRVPRSLLSSGQSSLPAFFRSGCFYVLLLLVAVVFLLTQAGAIRNFAEKVDRVLVGAGLKSDQAGEGQTPTEVGPTAAEPLALATSGPQATMTPDSTPTRAPTATLPVLVIESDSNPCIDWNEVGLDDVGKTLCVQGTVIDTYSQNDVFYFIFSNDPKDFYMIQYGGISWGGVLNTCVYQTGEIKSIGQAPVMVIDRVLYRCR